MQFPISSERKSHIIALAPILGDKNNEVGQPFLSVFLFFLRVLLFFVACTVSQQFTGNSMNSVERILVFVCQEGDCSQ